MFAFVEDLKVGNYYTVCELNLQNKSRESRQHDEDFVANRIQKELMQLHKIVAPTLGQKPSINVSVNLNIGKAIQKYPTAIQAFVLTIRSKFATHTLKIRQFDQTAQNRQIVSNHRLRQITALQALASRTKSKNPKN